MRNEPTVCPINGSGGAMFDYDGPAISQADIDEAVAEGASS